MENRYIERTLGPVIRRAAKEFPAVAPLFLAYSDLLDKSSTEVSSVSLY